MFQKYFNLATLTIVNKGLEICIKKREWEIALTVYKIIIIVRVLKFKGKLGVFVLYDLIVNFIRKKLSVETTILL